MTIPSLKVAIKQAIIIGVLFSFCPYLFAQEQTDTCQLIQAKKTPKAKAKAKVKKTKASASHNSITGLTLEEEKKLNDLQKLSRVYRQQGVQLQAVGNVGGAASFYRKAIELDPFYAVPYNDLGIIYEMQGNPQSAEESYLRSIQIDPNYLSAYSNLALLYENQRNLEKAAFYWQKRAELGPADDPWTIKASRRLSDVRLALGYDEFGNLTEKEVLGLVKDTSKDKSVLRDDDKALARTHLNKAKLYYKKGDEIQALKEAINAKQIDPASIEINEFIDKVQKRLLSR